MVFLEVVNFFVRLFVAIMVLHRIAAAARVNLTVQDEFSGSWSGLGPRNESTPPPTSSGVSGSPVPDGDDSTTVKVAVSVTGALAGLAGVVVAALCVRHMLKRHRDNEQAEQIQMDELESVSGVRESKRMLPAEVNFVLTVGCSPICKGFRELQWIRAREAEPRLSQIYTCKRLHIGLLHATVHQHDHTHLKNTICEIKSLHIAQLR